MNAFFRQLFSASRSPYGVSVLAWATLTATLLGIRSGLLSPVVAISALLVALLAVLRVRQPFGRSHSTRDLLMAARKSAAGASGLLHRPTHRRTPVITAWPLLVLSASAAAIAGFMLGLVENTLYWQLVLLIFGLVYASWKKIVWLQILGLIAFYVVVLRVPQPVAVYLSLLVLIAVLALAWFQHRWIVLIPVILGGYWVVDQTLPQILGFILLFATLYGVSAVIVTGKRIPNEREAVRTVLAIAYAPALLLLLHYGQTLVSVPIILALLAAALAWSQHGRYSYAKYFFLIATYLFLTVLAVSFSSGWLILAGMITASALLAVGSSVNSCTLRLAGLATIGGSLALYMVEVLPVIPNLHTEPILNRLGLGLLLALSLPILADWYATLTLDAFEQRLAAGLRGQLSGVSALLLFGLIFLQTQTWLQSLLLITLGGLVLIVAKLRNLPLLRTAAYVTLFTALLKLVTVDAMFLPVHWQYATWSAVAIFCSLLLWCRPKLVGNVST